MDLGVEEGEMQCQGKQMGKEQTQCHAAGGGSMPLKTVLGVLGHNGIGM